MFKVTVFYGEEHGYFFLKNISQYKKQVSIKQNTFKTLCDCEKKIIKKILLNEIILKDESQHAPMCPIFLQDHLILLKNKKWTTNGSQNWSIMKPKPNPSVSQEVRSKILQNSITTLQVKKCMELSNIYMMLLVIANKLRQSQGGLSHSY